MMINEDMMNGSRSWIDENDALLKWKLDRWLVLQGSTQKSCFVSIPCMNFTFSYSGFFTWSTLPFQVAFLSSL